MQTRHRLALSTERLRCTNRIAVSLLRSRDTERGYRAATFVPALWRSRLLVFRAAGITPAAAKRQSRLLTLGERIYRVYTSISSNKRMRYRDKQMAMASINTRAVRRDDRGKLLAHWVFTLLWFVRSVFL